MYVYSHKKTHTHTHTYRKKEIQLTSDAHTKNACLSNSACLIEDVEDEDVESQNHFIRVNKPVVVGQASKQAVSLHAFTCVCVYV
jgi:hypothetical protein